MEEFISIVIHHAMDTETHSLCRGTIVLGAVTRLLVDAVLVSTCSFSDLLGLDRVLSPNGLMIRLVSAPGDNQNKMEDIKCCLYRGKASYLTVVSLVLSSSTDGKTVCETRLFYSGKTSMTV
jgi:hypothetical protein